MKKMKFELFIFWGKNAFSKFLPAKKVTFGQEPQQNNYAPPVPLAGELNKNTGEAEMLNFYRSRVSFKGHSAKILIKKF